MEKQDPSSAAGTGAITKGPFQAGWEIPGCLVAAPEEEPRFHVGPWGMGPVLP